MVGSIPFFSPMGFAGGIVGPGFSPASLFVGRSGGAWYTSSDNTYLTVNSDGTGGAVANNGTVGRWVDRSGFNNHLSQGTATVRPVYRTGEGVSFFWATNGSTRHAALLNASTTAFPFADYSGGFVAWAAGTNENAFVDFGSLNASFTSGTDVDKTLAGYNDFGSLPVTGALALSRKVVVTWRSNATHIIMRVNGVEYTLSPYANQTNPLTKINLSQFAGGGGLPSKMIELVAYDYDVGETNIVSLESYLRGIAGTYDNTRSVAVFGDSLSMGTGSEAAKPWHWLIQDRPNSRWHADAVDGAQLLVPVTSAANFLAFKGSVEGIAIIWYGTNDLVTAGKTGLQVAAGLKAYSDTLRTGGMKVVVCTLQGISTKTAEVLACNAQIATDASHYDAIADLYGNPELQNSTNNTYFTGDLVHMMDAGYAIVAATINAALVTTATGTDTTAPTVAVFEPADNATGQSLSSALIAIMWERVTLGATGIITLKKTSDNSTVDSWDVATDGGSGAGQVEIINSQRLTLHLTSNMPASTEMYVVWDAGVVKDAASNPIAALTSTTAWSFTTGTGFSGLLDVLGVTAARAYSTRKLRDGYAGSALRIRRSTDNVEQDIGFSGEDLDTAAITAFIGANSAFVVKWYDQSGTGDDAVQATTANQARVVNAGTLDVRNTKACPLFNGTTNKYVSGSALTAAESSALVAINNAGPNFGSFWAAFEGAGTVSLIQGNSGSASYLSTGANVNNTGSGAAVFSSVLQQVRSTHSGSPAYVQIGNDDGGGGRFWPGWIGEAIVFAAALSAGNRTAMYTNQKTYWGTP